MLSLRIIFLTLICIAAFAVVPIDDNYLEILPPTFDGHPPVNPSYLNNPTQIDYLSEFGNWIGLPNKYTGKAYKSWGPGIAIPGWSEDIDIAMNSLLDFIDKNQNVFWVNIENLRTIRFEKHLDVWFAIFDQVIEGHRIHGSRLDLRVSPDGKLFLIGDQTLPSKRLSWPKDCLPIENLITLAAGDLNRDYSEYRIGEEHWLPIENEIGELILRPVVQIYLKVKYTPAEWLNYVDVVTGETLMRVNQYYYLSGNVQAYVEVAPVSPWNAVLTRDVRWGTVNFGSYSGNTNTDGYYSFSASGTNTLTHALVGPYFNVNDETGGEPLYSVTVSGSSTHNILMDDSNSEPQERDVYVWAARTLYLTKLLDPSFTGMDWQVDCNTDINSTCNAYWDGSSINFYQAGDGCENTARLKDVIMHEYTHGVTSAIFDGSSYMPLLAVNECWSDFLPCTDSGDPELGRGFFGASSHLRNLDNTLAYPDDWEGEGHHDGQILGGALWDMRENLGPGHGYTDTLFQYARYGLPYNFFDYYYDILAVDDDDADLSNGTPNFCHIADAFGRHGIGSGPQPTLTHTPYNDTYETATSYTLTAQLLQCADYSWAADSVLIRWSIDGINWNNSIMTSTDGYNWTGNIPAQPGGRVVRYGIIVKDNIGNSIIHPSTWPMHKHIFAVGIQVDIFDDNFESDLGWTSGVPDDDASTGAWVREDPYETYNSSSGLIYQSGDDVTDSPGVKCWVTGNASMSYGAGHADVDGGKVTLLSPIFDLASYRDPVLTYYRWVTNETSLDDSFWVWASGDAGATWQLVEYVPSTENTWKELRFPIKDLTSLTSTVRFKFVATDYRDGSLTEGMVDEFSIVAFTEMGLIDEEVTKTPDKLEIDISPNPFNASVRIELNQKVDEIEILDILGKKLFSKNNTNSLIWQGRASNGDDCPSGIYFVRIKFENKIKTNRLIMIK